MLPLVVRGRGALPDALAAILWATTLAAITPLLTAGLAGRAAIGHLAQAAPRGLILGSALGAVFAVAACALRERAGRSITSMAPGRRAIGRDPQSMNPLRTLETMLASLVEGAFGRIFRSEVRPMELARKLTREMDEHRTASVSRVYAPNEYAVWLSPEDRARYEGVEHELIDELAAYLLEHARAEQLTLVSLPAIAFHTDAELSLGEFGIQARLVRLDGDNGEREGHPPPDHAAPGPDGPLRPWRAPAAAGAHGQTMIWSTSKRLRGPLERPAAAVPRLAVHRGRCCYSTAGVCWWRRPVPSSAAAAIATSCWRTPASRGGTPASARTPRAGRSKTWDPPTGYVSTTSWSTARAAAPG